MGRGRGYTGTKSLDGAVVELEIGVLDGAGIMSMPMPVYLSLKALSLRSRMARLKSMALITSKQGFNNGPLMIPLLTLKQSCKSSQRRVYRLISRSRQRIL